MRRSPTFAALRLIAVCLVAYLLPTSAHAQDGAQDIDDVSLESLLDVQVSAASKYDQTAREAPASVTVITSEQIDRFGYRTLQDVLASVRGFYLNNTWDLPYAGVRGFSRLGEVNNRILVLLNGHTLNELASGYVSIDERVGVNLDVVERIEIIRGPGSALYGTGAMFAVINIVTRDASQGAAAYVTGGSGSFGEVQGRASAVRRLGSRGYVTVAGHARDYPGQNVYFSEFDAPATNHGVATRQDWVRNYGGEVHASYGRLSFQSSFMHDQRGLGMPSASRFFNHDSTRMYMAHGFAELRYEQAFSPRQQLLVRGHYHTVDYTMSNAYPWSVVPFDITPPAGHDALVVHEEARSHGIGGEAQLRWDATPRHRVIAGAEYRHAWINSGGRVPALGVDLGGPSFSVHSFSAYAQDEFRLTHALAFTLGLRHDHYLDRGSATTPRLAAVYTPSRTRSYKVLYGEAFRVPGLYEGYTGANAGLFTEDTGLTPERIRTLEVITEHRLRPGLTGMLTGFYYAMHDLIDNVYDSERDLWMHKNLGRVHARGIEAELNLQTEGGLHGYLSYTYQHGRDVRADQHLYNAPHHLVKAGLATPVGKGFDVVPAVRFEDGRMTDQGAETKAFVTADLLVRTPPLFRLVEVSAAVHNVFDHRYLLPTGFGHGHATIEQRGRTLVVRAEVRL